MQERNERSLWWVFDVALVIKAFDGALEIAAAFFILFVPPAFMLRIADIATGGELATDPGDFVATIIRTLANSFAIHTHYLIALYLVLHGAVKIALVVGIFSGKKFAYPLFMYALAIFGAYETYRGVVRHEVLLEALAVLDFAILILTAYEYRRRYPAIPRPDID